MNWIKWLRNLFNRTDVSVVLIIKMIQLLEKNLVTVAKSYCTKRQEILHKLPPMQQPFNSVLRETNLEEITYIHSQRSEED
jgi:recombinational DNA repair ATPase RecF